jgi:hypothetical protein
MINKRDGIRAMKRGVLAVFLVLTISSVSQAGPLGVTIDPIPSLIAGFINTTYNVLTGAFNANGFASTLDRGLGSKAPISGAFSLQATIDSSGNATNATIRVGTVAAPALFSQVLLPPSFAFNAISGGSLEFLFTTVSGSYVTSGIYSATQPLDVMLTGVGFPGSFATSWSSTGSTAEIREDAPGIPNPEPSTLLVMLAGAAGLFIYRRKHSLSKGLL